MEASSSESSSKYTILTNELNVDEPVLPSDLLCLDDRLDSYRYLSLEYCFCRRSLGDRDRERDLGRDSNLFRLLEPG